jgi:hypothetical protein
MSDFTPVALVKGDVEFTATTATELINALYAQGFKRKKVAPTPAAAPAPAPAADEVPAEGEAPKARGRKPADA